MIRRQPGPENLVRPIQPHTCVDKVQLGYVRQHTVDDRSCDNLPVTPHSVSGPLWEDSREVKKAGRQEVVQGVPLDPRRAVSPPDRLRTASGDQVAHDDDAFADPRRRSSAESPDGATTLRQRHRRIQMHERSAQPSVGVLQTQLYCAATLQLRKFEGLDKLPQCCRTHHDKPRAFQKPKPILLAREIALLLAKDGECVGGGAADPTGTSSASGIAKSPSDVMSR